ncbi:uncharacterized protein [Apostichopus japonicus]|uniref:uncharacterized protein n=1 Tax=Stichopus japonicus TaxID=307972 RepID=UPI003AB39B8F
MDAYDSSDTVRLSPTQSAISDALPSLPLALANGVLDQLVDVGVESVGDLRFVTEDDLSMLKPIQRRRLIDAWSTAGEDTAPENVLSEGEETVDLDTSTLSTESTPDIHTQPSRDQCAGNWADTFEVHWSKMSKNLNNCLKKKKRPAPRERREMIRVICDDIFKLDESPGRKNLVTVAKKVVSAYPASFRDDIGGEVIGDGTASILKQLENRVNNLKRDESYLPVPSVSSSMTSTSDEEVTEPKTKRIKKRDSYGCINWQPGGFPEGETEATQKEKILALKEMYAAGEKDWDEDLITSHMQSVYFSIRTLINSKSVTIEGLLEEYPFLSEKLGMFLHFKELVGIDLLPTLEHSLETKGRRILRYFRKCPTKSITMKDTLKNIETMKLEAQDNSAELPGLICLLASYFGEDASSFLHLSQETNTVEEVADEIGSPSPCIVVFGPTLLAGRHFGIVVDKVPVNNHKINDFAISLGMLFASFYAFNIEYPAKGAVTMEFIQRCFVGLNPNTSAKSKLKSAVHPKVVTLLGQMKDFESEWDL